MKPLVPIIGGIIVLLFWADHVCGQRAKTDETARLTETLKVENITIHYARSHTADAKQVVDFLKRAVTQLKAHFQPAGLDEFVTGFKCDFYLHPTPTDKASESLATCHSGTTDGTNRTYYADIYLLTPSAHSEKAKNHIGEPKDSKYFERLVVHEYAAPVLDRISRSKPDGWRFFQSPRWFIQGYEEYLALTCSNEHSRKVTMTEYRKMVRSEPKRVRNDFGLVVQDEYIDGAMLVAFIHEQYGKEKAQSILTSRAESFGEAITQSLEVNLDTFFSAWRQWLEKDAAR